jgi:hypothetical protein
MTSMNFSLPLSIQDFNIQTTYEDEDDWDFICVGLMDDPACPAESAPPSPTTTSIQLFMGA